MNTQATQELVNLFDQKVFIISQASGASDQIYALVKELLSKGADPNVCGAYGQNILLDAVVHSEDRLVLALLQAQADPNVMKFADIKPPLCIAIERAIAYEHSHRVAELSSGEGFNSKEELIVLKTKEINIVNYLLAHGAKNVGPKDAYFSVFLRQWGGECELGSFSMDDFVLGLAEKLLDYGLSPEQYLQSQHDDRSWLDKFKERMILRDRKDIFQQAVSQHIDIQAHPGRPVLKF